MSERVVLALDIGASNGRGVLGVYDEDGKLLKTREIHRFFHRYVRMESGVYWDYITIYNNMLECLRLCKKQDISLECIAIDTWGQDYAYVGKHGEVLCLPRSYRDPVNTTHGDDLEKRLGMDAFELYMHSGAVLGGISTIRQLNHDREHLPELFDNAKYWLYMPYLFVYLLSGTAGCDVSLPAVASALDLQTMDFSRRTAEAVGYWDKLPPRYQSGTIMAVTNQTVKDATGYDRIPIACIDGHDTSSAVSAIPDTGEFLWISSGTYNMLGAVTEEFSVNPELYDMNCNTAPLGDGRPCMMCGAAGMYFIQQSMNHWQDEGLDVTYEGMTAYAVTHESDEWFSFDGIPSITPDMPAELRAACERNGFAAPETPEDLYVAFANSLARYTASRLSALEKTLGKSFDKIYVLGGGSKADGVNKRIASLTGKTLYTGLSEASSIGNLLAQLVAIGAVTREETAAVTANSFEIREFSAE